MTSSVRATFAVVFAASLALAAPLPASATTSHITIHNETGAPVAVTLFEAWSGAGIAPTADGGPALTTTCVEPRATYSQSFSNRIGEIRFEVRHAGCGNPTIHRDGRTFPKGSSSQTYFIRESGGRYSVN